MPWQKLYPVGKLPIHIKYLFLGSLVLSFLTLMNYYLTHSFIRGGSGDTFEWGPYIIYSFSVYPIWILLAPYIFLKNNRLGSLRLRNNLFLYLLFSIIFVLIHRIISSPLMFLTMHIYGFEEVGMSTVILTLKSTPSKVLAHLPEYWFFSGLLFFIDFYKKSHQKKLKLLEVKQQLAIANLNSLKTQIHPHFLFNALNSIAALLDTNIEKAKTVLVKLADLLSMTLQVNNENLIKVGDELSCAEKYIEIQEIRFGSRMEVNWEVDEQALGAYMPPFIIQPLLENTVKHKISRSHLPVYINIRIQARENTLFLSVEDYYEGNDTRLEKVKDNIGTGIQNMRKRLESIYLSNFSFEAGNNTRGGFTVTLSLPLQFTKSKQSHDQGNYSG